VELVDSLKGKEREEEEEELAQTRGEREVEEGEHGDEVERASRETEGEKAKMDVELGQGGRVEGGVNKGCEARSSKSSSPPLFFPFLPSPQTISIAVFGLLGMDEILAQIAQLREQARLQAVANEAQASSLLLLSFSVRAQEAAIARLSSENETLKKTVGDQDGVIGELVRAHPSGGFWIWERGKEGRVEGGRWLWEFGQ